MQWMDISMEKREMSGIVSVCSRCGGDVVVKEVEKMVKTYKQF